MTAPLERTDLLDKGFIELLAILGDDGTVVSSARVSYLGESKGEKKDRALIRYLSDHRHTSPFEHVIFQFRVKAPVVVWWQWVRHRTWSYNFQSGRYTPFEENEYYVPNTWRLQAKSNKQASLEEGFDGFMSWTRDGIRVGGTPSQLFEEVADWTYSIYQAMLDNGIAREQARLVLPFGAMYYTAYATVDLHNLLHFLSLRNTPEAQWEIRQYAEALESIIEPYVPWSMEAWHGFNDKWRAFLDTLT